MPPLRPPQLAPTMLPPAVLLATEPATLPYAMRDAADVVGLRVSYHDDDDDDTLGVLRWSVAGLVLRAEMGLWQIVRSRNVFFR